jgi:hypothetical protein
MDRIKSAARQSDAVTLPVRQAGFNHYIPAVFYTDSVISPGDETVDA